MSSFLLWIYRLLTWWLPESRGFGFKCLLLRLAGAKLGANVRPYSSAVFLGNGQLEIGEDVHLGPGVTLFPVSPAKVTIGSCVDFGPGATVLTGSHEIDFDGPHVAGRGTAESVEIGDGCWIGARALILPGVKLPPKTLVAAGAVVVKSPERSGLRLAGVPARPLGEPRA